VSAESAESVESGERARTPARLYGNLRCILHLDKDQRQL